MKPVYYASSEQDASIVKGYLESCGVSVHMVENLKAWLTGYSTDYVLAVAETDLEHASNLLKDRNPIT